MVIRHEITDRSVEEKLLRSLLILASGLLSISASPRDHKNSFHHPDETLATLLSHV